MESWHQCPKTFQVDKDYTMHNITISQDGQDFSLPFRPPTQASRTVGYRLGLTVQSATEIVHKCAEGHTTTSQAIHGSLPKTDMIRMYFSGMAPGRQYALILHILTNEQVNSIQAKSVPLLLCSLNLCSTLPRIFLHGPKQYGCAPYKLWSSDILTKQVSRLLTELCNNDQNGQGLECITSCIRRDVCSKTPFMALPYKPWGFLTKPSWIASI